MPALVIHSLIHISCFLPDRKKNGDPNQVQIAAFVCHRPVIVNTALLC